MSKLQTNRIINNMAKFGDKAIAYLIAFFMTSRDVQNDFTDPENLNEPVLPRYRYHFTRRVKKQNEHRLEKFVGKKPDETVTKPTETDLLREIYDNGIGFIISDSNYSISGVRYFEQTEHQPATPMQCNYGDYKIVFASAGTKWCGGMRGKGFVYKRTPHGGYEQVAEISAELSDYLAQIVDNHVKSHLAR